MLPMQTKRIFMETRSYRVLEAFSVAAAGIAAPGVAALISGTMAWDASLKALSKQAHIGAASFTNSVKTGRSQSIVDSLCSWAFP